MLTSAQELADPLLWAALAASVLAVGVSGTVALVVARRRAAEPSAVPDEFQRAYAYLAKAFEQVDEQASRLRDAAERADEERRHLQRLRELRTTLDLQDVLERTLDLATSVEGVDAAMVAVRRPGTDPLVASRGLTPAEESARPPLSEIERAPGSRTVLFSYDFGNGAPEGALQGGILAPVRSELNEPVGTLALFWRWRTTPPDRVTEELKELVSASATAITNALSFAAVRESATRDPLTGLFNRSFFHDELGHEVTRAERYNRLLALVMLDVDEFKRINAELGHLDADAVLAEVGARIGTSTRSSDIAGRIGGDEFGVILPESGQNEAKRLYARLSRALASAPSLTSVQVTLSAGLAEFRQGDTPTVFFARAESALRAAKEAGKGQMLTASAEPPEGQHQRFGAEPV